MCSKMKTIKHLDNWQPQERPPTSKKRSTKHNSLNTISRDGMSYTHRNYCLHHLSRQYFLESVHTTGNNFPTELWSKTRNVCNSETGFVGPTNFLHEEGEMESPNTCTVSAQSVGANKEYCNRWSTVTGLILLSVATGTCL